MTKIEAKQVHILAALSFVTYVANIIVNALGARGDIGTMTNAQVSRLLPTAITPAGWAFSIWGFIFFLQALWTVLLCGWSVKQIFSKSSYSEHSLNVPTAAAALSYALPAAWFFEVVWTFAFNYEIIWLSLPLMYGILLSLAVAFTRIYNFLRTTWVLNHKPSYMDSNETVSTRLSRYLVLWAAAVPTAVNLGWICVAATVNTLVVITRYGGEQGADGGPYSVPRAENVIGALALPLIAFCVSVTSLRYMSASIAFAVAWGFFGAADKQDDRLIRPIATTCAVILLLVGLVSMISPLVSQRVTETLSFGKYRKVSHEAGEPLVQN